MKKMKLVVMHGVGKELTRDELKNVFGGGSGSGSGSVELGCAYLKEGSSCYYKDIDTKEIRSGICMYLPIAGLVCEDPVCLPKT